MTADVTASSGTTVYYDSFVGLSVPISVSSAFSSMNIVGDEISMGLNTSNILSGNLYDVFAVNNAGTLALCAGPAWTTTTSRSTAVTKINGIWLNGASMAHCYGGASGTTDYGTVGLEAGTYLGTFYDPVGTNGATAWVANPAGGTSGGSYNCLCLSNAYNRVPVTSTELEGASTWTNTGVNGWRFAHANTNNSIRIVDGLQQQNVQYVNNNGTANSGASDWCEIGVGVSTSLGISAVPTSYGYYLGNANSASLGFGLTVSQTYYPKLGLTILYGEEITNPAGSCTMQVGSTYALIATLSM